MRKRALGILILGVLAISPITPLVLGEDVAMITKEQLNEIFGKPDLVIFDVRLSSDYFSSDLKIKGAVRPEPGQPICGTAFTYPVTNTFVLYCASANEERSIINAKHLTDDHRGEGFTTANLFVLKGGWEEWLKAGLPTESK